jgi:ABC-type Na+ efflux pump permease subunit
VLGPIFLRELVTVPRRKSQTGTRVALLGLLAILGITTWQATVGFDRDPTLGEVARFGEVLFQLTVYVELVLLVFFSALSAASAVSQEKDRRTFILLLITDMRDYEIVLGKLLGSLLPITILLGISVPVLAMYLLLGGIDPEQVIQAALVLWATSFAAGSLGGLVALWRERTFQAVALTVLFIVLYLGLAQLVGAFSSAYLQSCLDPVRAMATVIDPPVTGWNGLAPSYGFTLTMLLWCCLLNAFGIWKLRKWNPSGEPIMQREGNQVDPEANLNQEELKAFRAKAHAAPGALRDVSQNPIFWRETRTLAYGRRPLLVKIAFAFVLAIILYSAFAKLSGGAVPTFAAAYGLVPLTIVSLLLVAAQAASSITSERDGGTLDVLLVTDVSPKEFVFGKIFGAIVNTKEYLLPPLLLAVYYGIAGYLTRTPADFTAFERFSANLLPMLTLIGSLLLMFAFVLALGIHVSLRVVNTRLALANVLGTVFFLCVGTLIAIYLIVINGGNFANQWFSFIGFLVVGIGGLWWVLTGNRPSTALSIAATACPMAMFYAVTNVLIAKPGTQESADPMVPFLVLAVAFGFTVYAMLLPLVTEFDVQLGRTTAANEE